MLKVGAILLEEDTEESVLVPAGDGKSEGGGDVDVDVDADDVAMIGSPISSLNFDCKSFSESTTTSACNGMESKNFFFLLPTSFIRFTFVKISSNLPLAKMRRFCSSSKAAIARLCDLLISFDSSTVIFFPVSVSILSKQGVSILRCI